MDAFLKMVRKNDAAVSLDNLFSLSNSSLGMGVAVLIITILFLSPISTQSFRLGSVNPNLNAKRNTNANLNANTNPQKQELRRRFDKTSTPHGKMRLSTQSSFKRKIAEEVAVMFGKRKDKVRQLLEDFSQPFLGTGAGHSFLSDSSGSYDDTDEGEIEEHTVVVENNKTSTSMTHFAFLVHGYNGQPADLRYLRCAMATIAAKELGCNDKSNNPKEISSQDRVVIHSCQTNYGQTGDGIAKGGTRILEEVLSVIREHSTRSTDDDEEAVDITVSFIGNSLGGLYSRYAIARLAELSSATDEQFILLEGNIRLHLNIFCSTATPHLGISGHTYFSLPRTAEIGIGKIMGQTGRDIFRISDLVRVMCTCPSYLEPLRLFRKRIAYANAYCTDFVVPTSTAAFLNPDSTYPHHTTTPTKDLDGESQTSSYKSGMVVATFNTPPGKSGSRPATPVDLSQDLSEGKRSMFKPTESQRRKNELLEMSNSLDCLGWKKVIVDVREHMPSFKIPNMVKKKSGIESESFTNMENEEMQSPDKGSSDILESRHVANAFSNYEDVLPFPLGHNTMVAVEKKSLTKSVFSGGRPLMDGLAKEILGEIFAWDDDSFLISRHNEMEI